MVTVKKYALYIVLALTFIACAYAYFQFLKPLDVFIWDEAHHGFYGTMIFEDLRTMNFGAFWADTNRQALWMPLHSWFDGIFLLIFGFSYTSARLSSLFLFFACSILIYLIGQELSKEKGWIVGLVACILFLTSPMMLHFATVNMQEMLGTFVILLTAYFIIRNISFEAAWKYLCIGFLLSVIYWTKINYATQTILGVGIFHISMMPGFDRKKLEAIKKWFVNGLLIITGFLPLLILWWATPPFQRKLGLGVFFILQKGASSFPDIGFLGRIIFYLQSLVSSYNFSFWTGLGCLAAVIASFRLYSDRKIRLLSLIFMANLVMVSAVLNIQERYLGTTVPFTFLLLADLSVRAFDRLKLLNIKSNALAVALLAFIACAVGYDAMSLTRYTKEVANRSILFCIYKDSLNKYSPPFLFGLMKRPAFTYPMDQTKKYNNFKVQPKSSIKDILNYFSDNVERGKSISTLISFAELSPYVIYWHFHGWGAPVLTENDLGMNQMYFWYSDYFIDLQASEDSPYYNISEKKWNEVSKALLKEGAIKLLMKKEYPDLGFTAKIYKRQRLFYLK